MSTLIKLSRQFWQISQVSRVHNLGIRNQHTRIKPKPGAIVSNNDVPVFRKATNFSNNLALRDSYGCYTYGNLFVTANNLSKEFAKCLEGKTGEQVVFVCPNNANYIIAQWAIWIAGQTAVPVHHSYPQSLIEYYANDSNCKLLVTTSAYAELMQKVSKACGKPLYVLDETLQEKIGKNAPVFPRDLEGGYPNEFYAKHNAMILYTSGTTGKPKGVAITHKNLISQINAMVDAWKWTSNDTILHTLPLHHVHGIVNALLCPLYVGAKCNMLEKFDSNDVWTHLLGINSNNGDRKVSVFMAVPTIYTKLIEEYDRIFSKDPKMTEYIKNALKKLRLMVSGSAPLPVTVYEKWLSISGQKLLERYGMTEIGMCLSQEFDSNREPGYVGVPLPGVSIRLGNPPEEDEGDYTTLLECSNINSNVQLQLNKSLTFDKDPVGELLVKGDSVFSEYLGNVDATQKAFTVGQWFKTGDTCQFCMDKKLFKILGRTSVDVIKTGGYKVSALEIESKLFEHPDISDCAVVGLKDETWGEVVAAIVTLKKDSPKLSLDELKPWANERMASYAVPKLLKIVDSIPKNAMGKVNKRELVSTLFPSSV